MPSPWAFLSAKPGLIGVGLGAFTIVLAAGAVARRYFRRRPTPNELEQLRRITIHKSGKMGDGEIIDIAGALIVYSYSVAGVSYTASQDITELQTALPLDPLAMIGPVSIKFNPRNPANSIVMCEEWSGVRSPEPQSIKQLA